MSETASTAVRPHWAGQTLINLAVLVGLYASAWAEKTAWGWFFGAVGLSMAWVTPATLVEGLKVYARAVYAMPPQRAQGEGPSGPSDGQTPTNPSAPSSPSADRSDGFRMSAAPTPPGVFGLFELLHSMGLPRPLLRVGGVLLLGATLALGGCTRAQGESMGVTLDGIWKVVTMTCSGVRTVAPFVEAIRPRAEMDAADTTDATDATTPTDGR